MLHLIPAPLHRQLYRLAHALRRQWWRIRRPRLNGVIVIAFDDADRVLLVRHSYGSPLWSLPGGGMVRGEDPEQAAMREIREELGCGLADLVLLDVSEEHVPGSRDREHAFLARLVGEPVPDMREIVAVGFFDPERSLDNCGRRSRRRIEQALALRHAAAARSQQG
jgi:8-oxo-dGTP pyrophosphatase MutT (NUDIX family)